MLRTKIKVLLFNSYLLIIAIALVMIFNYCNEFKKYKFNRNILYYIYSQLFDIIIFYYTFNE